MSDELKPIQARQEKVYAEASQWIRLINHIIWGLGGLFVPTSFAALWIGVRAEEYSTVAALISVVLFTSWVLITRIYATSSKNARQTLMRIESEWELPDELCLYKHQDDLIYKKI